MFGGLDLSRNQEWVDATIKFAVDGFVGSQKIKAYPAMLKPIAATFIPELRRMSGHYQTARKVVIPILEARERIAAEACDFLQWMVEDAHEDEKAKEFIAEILLKMSFAAIHTSAATPMQLIYDLCMKPEYIDPLRNEIADTIPTYRTRLDKQDVAKLYKLDSIMKESLRFHPLLLSQASKGWLLT